MDQRPKNSALDALIARLAPALNRAEDALVEAGSRPTRPLVLVVGPPRSGTTLTLQWLAGSGAFGVPTNLMTRFAAAPSLAASIQRILLDPELDFDGQLRDLRPEDPEFESNYGRTRGALAPNEFFHFWRRHLGTREIEPLGPERRAAVDVPRLLGELAGLERALGRPLAMKGMMLQYDVDWAASIIPTAIFVHVRRDVVDNAASLLRGRVEEAGSESSWWSARPPGADDLAACSPERQVVEQVVRSHTAIETALAALPAERRLAVDYAGLCESPRSVWRELRERCSALGEELPVRPSGPDRFEVRRPTMDPTRRAALAAALDAVGDPRGRPATGAGR